MPKKYLAWFLAILIACFAGQGAEHRTFNEILELQNAEKEEMLRRQRLLEQQRQKWVDSILQNMSIEERIGQLFMVAAYSNKDESHYREIEKLITQYHIGGLIFFQGGPIRQAILTNRYQKLAKTKLLIGIDAEWGLGMRLDSTMSFPRQMTLGAIQDNQLIFQMGQEIGKQCRRIGIHINFAPVVDININPSNPVIGSRSFGENKINTALKGSAYARGLQLEKVLAVAKHFPGHGDTDKDSHYTLPILYHNKQRLHEIELYPFRQLIADSVAGIMVAHLHIPAYDSMPQRPTTLSPIVVKSLLRDSLNFRGLIFTDALNMQAITKFYAPGEADLQAFIAGNDILLYPNDVAKAVETFKKALADSIISESQINEKVKKILRAKFDVGLHEYQPIELAGIYSDLQTTSALQIKAKLYQKAITVVKNVKNALPIQTRDTLQIAVVCSNSNANAPLLQLLPKYHTNLKVYHISKNISKENLIGMFSLLKKADIIVFAFLGMNSRASENYGIPQHIGELAKKLEEHTKTIAIAFGSPYSLRLLDNFSHIICAYEEDELAQQAALQVLFGAIGSNGKLPVSSGNFKEGTGIELSSLKRFGFGIPESVGMNSQILQQIDSIVLDGITQKAMPGAQVVVAKNGIVVYQKSFGYQTYQPISPITDTTYYDIASLTKVISTLQVLMWLYDNKRLDLDKTVKDYLPETDTTNKGDMIIKEILCHQAGLLAFMTFWEKFVKNKKIDPNFLSETPSEKFPIQVTPYLYASSAVTDSIWRWIWESRLTIRKNPKGGFGYLYSDFGFMIMRKIAERITGESIEKTANRLFFNPLSLKITYNPLQKGIRKEQIAPTEMDTDFRQGLLHGSVHDPAAALQGGVEGHAGLFANALSVAVIMQMNLQEGYYNGIQFFSPQTVNTFNTRPYIHNNNRRALGWDKPDLEDKKATGISQYCSDFTFGHTGFTGVCAWADPAYDIVFVFLSNRIYPTVNNKKLITLNIRTRIHDVIYKSIGLPIAL
ncbi:MAG: serine hydrolase [Cytophagales bacterium]|nr:serine hydrolase [Cytophagales bacterium]MDW8383599.1 glycoside hydrolase family 3 N-terminal domain-containing protein [Flammeovirgaceae bacterium]